MGRQYEDEQKRCFAAVLEETTTRNGATFICEECKLNAGSLSSELAKRHDCHHVNLTMPHAERNRLKIPPNQILFHVKR